ncbi:potassium channel family protein [Methylophaga sp. OBS4]|uniref:potassium channel family protein n=1 Tax=Methylophaga sp. OBS4 TaxID=2991935 RepID=UPI002258B082|nr:NAD-binding protein [Methylophaga sp. OBS4]MCX4186228.1 NAD-binding protein [Methylophaga sp. OBS4]
MRAVFIGGSALSVMTASILTNRGHEVVIIEHDKERIDALSEDMSCGFLLGDGTRPALLKEADPSQTDILFCLTSNDQTNIIASLVGLSLGFKRVVTGIENPEYEHICIELGLEDTIIPARTIGSYLADMLEGQDPLVLSTMIRDEARVFSFVIRKEDAGAISELELPSESRVVCLYRKNKFIVPEEDTELKAEDEVVIVTHRRNLAELSRRWGL